MGAARSGADLPSVVRPVVCPAPHLALFSALASTLAQALPAALAPALASTLPPALGSALHPAIPRLGSALPPALSSAHYSGRDRGSRRSSTAVSPLRRTMYAPFSGTSLTASTSSVPR